MLLLSEIIIFNPPVRCQSLSLCDWQKNVYDLRQTRKDAKQLRGHR